MSSGPTKLNCHRSFCSVIRIESSGDRLFLLVISQPKFQQVRDETVVESLVTVVNHVTSCTINEPNDAN